MPQPYAAVSLTTNSSSIPKPTVSIVQDLEKKSMMTSATLPFDLSQQPSIFICYNLSLRRNQQFTSIHFTPNQQY